LGAWKGEGIGGGEIMIKNDRQYDYTKKKLREFERDLKAIRKKYVREKRKAALFSRGYVEHIAQLKTELTEYEKMCTSSSRSTCTGR